MRRPLIGFALSALAFGALAGTAGSEPPSSVGWWTSTPGAAAAEEGGFEVSAVAGSNVSVAALRFAGAPAGATATLTLTESGGTVTPTTALQACPTTESWEPANPGPLEDAPEPDCSAGVALTRDEAAATWTASVGGILGAGTVMIVPGGAPGGGSPLDVGFRVTFSRADLVVTTASGAGPTPAPLPGSSPSGGSGGSSGGSSFPSSSPSPSASPSPSISGTGPVTPTTVAPSGGTTVTTVAVEEGDASGTSEEAFGAPELAAGATVGGGGSDQPWERLLFLVPLSALAGVLWIYTKRFLSQRGMLEEA